MSIDLENKLFQFELDWPSCWQRIVEPRPSTPGTCFFSTWLTMLNSNHKHMFTSDYVCYELWFQPLPETPAESRYRFLLCVNIPVSSWMFWRWQSRTLMPHPLLWIIGLRNLWDLVRRIVFNCIHQSIQKNPHVAFAVDAMIPPRTFYMWK